MTQWTDLARQGIDVVRVLWPDLHGSARGKDVMVEEIHRVADHGLGFCQALMVTDLSAIPVPSKHTDAGGWSDAIARPDPATLRPVPYAPGVALCLADILDPATGRSHALSPRSVLQRQIERAAAMGFTAVMAPELEFYLCRADESGEHGWAPLIAKDFGGYLVGQALDPDDVLLSMMRDCRAMELEVFAGNHEFSGGQLEINHAHSEALSAMDRAFLFRYAIKELAARRGLRATFMGKPFNGRAGSGMHLHLSLVDAEKRNVFDDPADHQGLSVLARQFIAGVLEHASANTALLCPNVNAFTRINEEGSLVPSSATWGLDNRTAYVRIPPERGPAARLEVRAADASANPYLAAAALLAAGLDGVERELVPPPDVAPGHEGPQTLPRDPVSAMEALSGDARLGEALGFELVEAFVGLKNQEARRFSQAVTDWEFEEFSWLL